MDTGSTDRTAARARALGARVLRGRIDGDFSAARNRLIDAARQPWILFLDADEVLSAKDARTLVRRLARPAADAFRLEVRHYTDEYNLLDGWTPCTGEYVKEERLSGKSGFYRTERILLFRSAPDIRYELPIHESLLPALTRRRKRIRDLPVVVHHYEFEKGARHHLRKHRRYLRMERRLLTTLSKRSPCYAPLLRSAIADLAAVGGDLPSAARLCEKLVSATPKDEKGWMWKARVAMLRRRPDEADRALERSIAVRTTYDNLCLAAWNRIESGRDGAAALLDRAIARDPRHPVGLHLKGVVLANAGRPRAALTFLDRALAAHPRYAVCLVNRAIVLLAMGRKAAAARDLRSARALTSDPALRKRAARLMKRTA